MDRHADSIISAELRDQIRARAREIAHASPPLTAEQIAIIKRTLVHPRLIEPVRLCNRRPRRQRPA